MKYFTVSKVKAVVGLLCVSLLVLACERIVPSKAANKVVNKSSLSVENAYMLATAPGQTRAAIYLTLINTSDHPRSINLVSANIAGYGEVHNHIHQNGVMSMRKVQHPQIAANASLVFSPGGYHIMLFDVAKPPAVGDNVELVLSFDKAETIVVPVDVRPVH